MILKLGKLDVSEYVCEGYSVDIEPVYDSTSSFTNMLGQDKSMLIGQKVHINANLGDIPADIAQQICSICESDTLSVTYATPKEYTATFKRPQIKSELTSEEPETWDIAITMSTDTIPLDGL